VQFAEEALDMAALLAQPIDPALKYEGAPPPKPAKAEPRRDEAEPDDELDLHGKTMEEAIRMVQHFLRAAHQRRLRSVVIVTGRGLNSGKEGPVLRGAVLNWLERNGAPYCREFGQAPGKHGGAGALLIRLR
jgi:DNA-nicking Smr family endonuclease